MSCRTSNNDPKAEYGQYILQAVGDDRLDLRQNSRYNWQLKESNCVADINETQTFTRVVLGATTPSRPTCRPGTATTLAVRPKKAALEPGQRICFRAVAMDANNCEIPDAPVEWSLRHSKALRGQLEGRCFRAADNAAEAEGEYRVIASWGALSDQAVVTVKAVDLSDFNRR